LSDIPVLCIGGAGGIDPFRFEPPFDKPYSPGTGGGPINPCFTALLSDASIPCVDGYVGDVLRPEREVSPSRESAENDTLKNVITYCLLIKVRCSLRHVHRSDLVCVNSDIDLMTIGICRCQNCQYVSNSICRSWSDNQPIRKPWNTVYNCMTPLRINIR